MCLAVPGQVVGRYERDGTAMCEVDFGGLRKQVCLSYLPDVTEGDYVIVHVGFAIQRLDERSALETLAEFERLGVLEEEFGDGFTAAAKQAGVDPGRAPGSTDPAGPDPGHPPGRFGRNGRSGAGRTTDEEVVP